MDKELIKMCDCPEIQDRWEPKVGDKYAYTRTNIIYMISDMEPFEECYPVNPFGGKFIYIPRIEDVLEWLNPYLNNGDAWPALKIDIKFCLHAYMHLGHNKTWDGEKWT